MPPRGLRQLIFAVVVSLSAAAFADDQQGGSLLVSPKPVAVRPHQRAAEAQVTGHPLKTRLPSRSKMPTPGGRPMKARRGNSTMTVVSSLAVVVGIFLLVAWVTRRAAPQSAQALPADVVQVLGRAPLAVRNTMHLVRIGNKLLLVSLTAQGASTLTEITDPQQVESLSAQCERSRPGSISATFRNVLHQFAEERAAPGFIGREREAGRQSR